MRNLIRQAPEATVSHAELLAVIEAVVPLAGATTDLWTALQPPVGGSALARRLVR